MADYFTVEVDEPVHLHSLMGTIAPTLKDSLGDLTTLLSIASAGKTHSSDYYCTLNRENQVARHSSPTTPLQTEQERVP